MADATDSLAELQRVNAELVAARRAALNVMEGAILARNALKASEERLRAVAANLPRGAVFVVDRDLRYSVAAGEALTAAGYSSTEVEGKTVAEVLPPDLAERHAANYRRALAGEPFRTEDAAHGRHYITHGVPLRDAAGQVTAALAVSYDITDRVRAEEARRAADEAVQQRERTFEAVVGSMPDLICLYDAARRRTYVNAAALALHRTAREAAVGSTVRATGYPTDVADRIDAALGAVLASGGPVRAELPLAPGREFECVFSPIIGPGGEVTGVAKLARDVTDRNAAERALAEARDRLEERVAERTSELGTAVNALKTEMQRRRGIALRLTTAQEDERRRVARDLHDTLGQLQAGLGLAVAGVRRTPSLPAPAAEQLAEIQRLVDILTRETHTLAVRLRPTVLDDLGLEPALRQLVSDFFAQTGLEVDFQTAGLEGERLPSEVETAIYRVVQEALTNVTQHADATRVGVAVVQTDGEVTTTVEDDGAGFDPATSGAGRLGLLGMRERVELVGGSLEVESSRGGGTTLYARIPLK